MAVCEITDRQHVWLSGELVHWRALGLVSDEQAGRIAALYGTTEELAQRRTARGLMTLMSLAAALVGLGVLLLIGYNWEALYASVKLAIIFVVLLGTHAAGFVLRYRLNRRAASATVFFLACLLFGAAIGLVAQIFNINADNPDVLWWWAIGTLPFALLLDTLPLHMLFGGLMAVYAGCSVFGSLPGAHLAFGWLPANVAVSVPFLLLPGLWTAYRKQSPAQVALYAPLFAWWMILQPIAWRLEENPILFIGCVGALMLIIAECHAHGSPLAIPFRFIGTALTAGLLIPLSYLSINRELSTSSLPRGTMVETAVAVVLAQLVLCTAAAIDRRRSASSRAGSLWEALGLTNRRCWVPLSLMLFFVILALWQTFLHEPVVPTVLANLAMISLSIWLMQLGLHADRGMPFSTGVLYFLLWAVLRYVDLFGDFGGMLGASAMFFMCGATMFGLATYWRRRTGVSHV